MTPVARFQFARQSIVVCTLSGHPKEFSDLIILWIVLNELLEDSGPIYQEIRMPPSTGIK